MNHRNNTLSHNCSVFISNPHPSYPYPSSISSDRNKGNRKTKGTIKKKPRYPGYHGNKHQPARPQKDQNHKTPKPFNLGRDSPSQIESHRHKPTQTSRNYPCTQSPFRPSFKKPTPGAQEQPDDQSGNPARDASYYCARRKPFHNQDECSGMVSRPCASASGCADLTGGRKPCGRYGRCSGRGFVGTERRWRGGSSGGAGAGVARRE